MKTQVDDAIYVIIGSMIRHVRRQANMSQQKLAEHLEMRRTSIVNIEAGRQHLPIHVLCTIAELFNIPISMFFQEVEGMEQSTPLAINAKLRLEIIQLREQMFKIREIVSQNQDTLLEEDGTQNGKH